MATAESLIELLPGCAVLHPPEDGNDAQIEDALFHARRSGAKFVQAILPINSPLGVSLARNGFRCVTQAVYMRCDWPAFPVREPRWLAFTPAAYSYQFGPTYMRSRELSLDIPEINDLRTLPELMSNAHPVLDCFLARDADQPVGVVKVSDDMGADRHLSFLGVLPEKRRQGYGRRMLAWMLWKAGEDKREGVTLCLDARNAPARKLYESAGFEEFGAEDVWLNLWEA